MEIISGRLGVLIRMVLVSGLVIDIYGANKISLLLAKKHSKDLWVPECNTGSAFIGCQRLDGWALKRTWSPVTAIGYEIKVSRSDFLRDDKWTGYLGTCHQFYFVCPYGLIQQEELPDDVGLMWVTKKGGRLYTKRKAVRHNPDSDAFSRIMTYVLMSRTRIVSDMWETTGWKPSSMSREQRAKYFAQQLAMGKTGELMRQMVSTAVAAERDHLRKKEMEINLRVDRVERISRALSELGIDVDDHDVSYAIQSLVGDVENMARHARRLKNYLDSFLREKENFSALVSGREERVDAS
jgi:hypothetical protein